LTAEGEAPEADWWRRDERLAKMGGRAGGWVPGPGGQDWEVGPGGNVTLLTGPPRRRSDDACQPGEAKAEDDEGEAPQPKWGASSGWGRAGGWWRAEEGKGEEDEGERWRAGGWWRAEEGKGEDDGGERREQGRAEEGRGKGWGPRPPPRPPPPPGEGWWSKMPPPIPPPSLRGPRGGRF